MRRPLSVISVCVQSFVNKIRCLFPSCPIKPGMTEGVTAKARSWRRRAGLRPGPVHAIWGRGLSERSEFRSPHTRDRGAGTPWGPRPGATGFGSFCRNKRTSSCGAETPQSSSPRRAGATPRETKAKILDPRSGSGMTESWMPDQAGHDGRRCGRAILWRFLPCGLPVIFCTVCKVLYNLYNLYNVYMLYVLYNFSHCFKRLPFSIFGRTPARNFLCLLSAVVLGLFLST